MPDTEQINDEKMAALVAQAVAAALPTALAQVVPAPAPAGMVNPAANVDPQVATTMDVVVNIPIRSIEQIWELPITRKGEGAMHAYHTERIGIVLPNGTVINGNINLFANTPDETKFKSELPMQVDPNDSSKKKKVEFKLAEYRAGTHVGQKDPDTKVTKVAPNKAAGLK